MFWARERYFSTLKGGIIGIFHDVSEANLRRWTAEFGHRYNTRKLTDVQRIEQSIPGILGKRLNYRRVGEIGQA
jgi:hypothetical protein